jgi:PhnB protein
MPKSPPEGMQNIIPMLTYEEAPAAISFLCTAFGFEERSRLEMPDGKIGHAEVGLGDSVLMLNSEYESMNLASPRRLPARHAQIYCYVDDVDAHYARALAAGATIVAEPQDQPYGARSYRAIDPEGHRFIFATPLSDVPAASRESA